MATALATQAALVSLNMFICCNPWTKWNIAQYCWVIQGETYCTILMQGNHVYYLGVALVCVSHSYKLQEKL